MSSLGADELRKSGRLHTWEEIKSVISDGRRVLTVRDLHKAYRMTASYSNIQRIMRLADKKLGVPSEVNSVGKSIPPSPDRPATP
jgi:hypothetical protein